MRDEYLFVYGTLRREPGCCGSAPACRSSPRPPRESRHGHYGEEEAGETGSPIDHVVLLG
jgi:hypothetical protein